LHFIGVDRNGFGIRVRVRRLPLPGQGKQEKRETDQAEFLPGAMQAQCSLDAEWAGYAN